MLIPVEWLTEYIDIREEPESLSGLLTMAGLEVTGVKIEHYGLDRVLIGRITAVAPHPKAPDVTVCEVDAGERTVKVITTAGGLAPGRLMPLVVAPGEMPTGKKIDAISYKGVDSEGMLCSKRELGLGDEEEIYELPADAPVGQNMAEFLGLADPALDIELTSNRPDCLSIMGVARELGALLRRDVRDPDLEFPEEAEGRAEELVKVIIEDPDLCPRYTARVFRDVRIEPSPLWMQRRLIASGMRPINNVVDITNYVMLETGQPIHAFDFTRIKNGVIRVRRARENETLVTLDGIERRLGADQLVIADDEDAVALAGIMGGELSEVTAETGLVLLESAYFDPISIRKTSRRQGLRSEASSRFEKGVDPNLADRASRRIAHFIARLGAGRIVPGVVDAYPEKIEPWTVELRPRKVERNLGLAVAPDTIRDALTRLGFGIRGDDERMTVTVPTFRPDITIEEDLIEEVAQLVGYDNIPTTMPRVGLMQGRLAATLEAEETVRRLMIGMHLQEISASSLLARTVLDQYPEPDLDRVVAPKNPMSEDYNTLRPSLFPSLLAVAAHNAAHRLDNLRLFEIGRGYLAAPEGADWPYAERRELSVGLLGQNWRGIVRQQEESLAEDFFTLKGLVENLLDGLGIAGCGFGPVADPRFTPGVAAELKAPDGRRLGVLGRIAKETADNFDVPDTLVAALILLDPVFEFMRTRCKMVDISRYPAVRRDMALVVDAALRSETIVNAVAGADSEGMIEDISFFDLFSGGKVPAGKKSIAYSITYRRPDRSLTNEEVDRYHNAILEAVGPELGAELRAF